jgi:hypothetical protein
MFQTMDVEAELSQVSAVQSQPSEPLDQSHLILQHPNLRHRQCALRELEHQAERPSNAWFGRSPFGRALAWFYTFPLWLDLGFA